MSQCDSGAVTTGRRCGMNGPWPSPPALPSTIQRDAPTQSACEDHPSAHPPTHIHTRFCKIWWQLKALFINTFKTWTCDANQWHLGFKMTIGRHFLSRQWRSWLDKPVFEKTITCTQSVLLLCYWFIQIRSNTLPLVYILMCFFSVLSRCCRYTYTLNPTEPLPYQTHSLPILAYW